MKGFLKIPYEWVQKSGQGLTATEALVLADIQYWKKQSTLAERSERLGLSIEGLRKALSKLQEKGFEIPQSRKYISTKLKNNFHKVENNTNKVEIEHQQSGNPPYNPSINIEDNKEYKDITLDKSNVPNANASAGKKTSQKKEKKEEPKVYTIQHRCRTFFETIYEQKKGDKYYYAAKDAAALKQLLNKIKFLMPEEQKNDEAKLEENFQIFINTIFHSKILGAWITDNLSLPIINDKFNEIYSQLKNGTAKQYRQQSGITDDQIRSIAERVAENGGLAF